LRKYDNILIFAEMGILKNQKSSFTSISSAFAMAAIALMLVFTSPLSIRPSWLRGIPASKAN
jgi:hypothetical protein